MRSLRIRGWLWLPSESIASFGIGTSLSNDFRSVSSGRKQKNKALNMVIKLYQVDGKFCAKISDELTKVSVWHCVYHILWRLTEFLRTQAIGKQSSRRRRFSGSMSSVTIPSCLENIWFLRQKAPRRGQLRARRPVFRPLFSRGSWQFSRVCKPVDLRVRGWCTSNGILGQTCVQFFLLFHSKGVVLYLTETSMFSNPPKRLSSVERMT